jgi:hypothetical protein
MGPNPEYNLSLVRRAWRVFFMGIWKQHDYR